MRWAVDALRRLREDRVSTVALVLLVLVTALVAALAPRILASLADGAIRAEAAAAPASERAITLVEHQLAGPGAPDDPVSEVRSAGQAHRARFPEAVRALVTGMDVVVDSGRFRVDTPTTDPAFLRLRVQDGITAHIRYVDGVPPSGAVATRDDVGPAGIDNVPVYEVAISEATAARFGLSVGQEVPLTGDPGDPLIGRTPEDVKAFVRITGTYAVPEPASDYWLDDALPIHPVIRALSSEVQLLDAVAILDPAAYGELAAHASAIGRSLSDQWRYRLDTAQLTAEGIPGLLSAFRALGVAYPSANVTVRQDVAMRTGMLALLEAHEAAWTAAASLIAVMVAGPVLVILGTLALITTLAGRRRRLTMALVRSRGATTAQVLVPTALEGLLLAVPAALVAAAAAVALVPGGAVSTTMAAALAVATTAVVIVVATVLPVARALGGPRRAGEGRRAGSTPRRLVVEALVIGLAVGGAWLLRARGLGAAAAAPGTAAATSATTDSAPGRGVDPLLAVVPVLVGVAAGLVVLRVVPWLMRAAASVASRRRGLVPMLAARRGAEGGIATVILLVLLATSTVGTFSLVALDGLDRGADVAAWQATGGAYRLDVASGALPRDLDPAALPGVQAAASEFQALLPIGLSGPQVAFTAVEADRLSAVLAGTPIAPTWPDGFTSPGDGAIPAILARSVTESPRGVRLGDTFQASVEGYTLTYRAAAVADTFPGLPVGRAFMVVPRAWVARQAPEARLIPTSAVLRAPAPPAAADAVRQAVAAVSPAVRVESQAEAAAARRDSPVTGAVRLVIIAVAALTAVYAALGVAAALALAALARVVEVAHLRTLGLTSRQAFLLTAAEHGPTAVLAFAGGMLLGAGLFAAVRPALGLEALVGAGEAVPLVIDPLAALAVLAVLALVVLAGLGTGAVLVRRVAPVTVLRGTFE